MMRFLVLALPGLGAGAAIAIGLARVAWPSSEFWASRNSWVVWAIVSAGVIPVVQTTISELGEKRRRTELEREDNVRSLLVSSLVVLARECKAPWDLTGVQAFLVTGWLWRKRQVRIAKIRLSSIPHSGVTWGKGKGVIGVCWETRSRQIAQLDQPPFSTLATVPSYKWPQVDSRLSYGLSYEDYQALGAKYGTVAAVPIMSSSDKYIGCVTFDVPPGVRLEQQERALESLATTAELVRRLLGR